MTEYTDEERQTLRTAIYGAGLLVSKADPGSMEVEGSATATAIKNLSPELQEALGTVFPKLPRGSAAQVEEVVLDALRESVAILKAKAPRVARAFPDAVVSVCDAAANADGDVSRPEVAAITKVKAVLAEEL
ncbi:hypothetical protein [Umezawaea sp. Da 62-37]|uniref:hypothetical protein n=1 Tax=Umezawaea sp. Da 62-37 TaxID=3075927 RepID=UPI0028F6E1DE|nr:hypothetical protein [Umezawaea sp. Da 62-37]WNV88779.1 hypothetical protein RM788_10910 [Umezawaea sp. Da 62-37]